MSIAFIDIDGTVLPFQDRLFRQEAVDVLKQYVAAGYKLVLHSAWRHDDGEERPLAYLLFEQNGIPLFDHCDPDEPSKSRAIQGWLDDNWGEVNPEDKIVIFDDSDLEFEVPYCIKFTPNPMVGITKAMLGPILDEEADIARLG